MRLEELLAAMRPCKARLWGVGARARPVKSCGEGPRTHHLYKKRKGGPPSRSGPLFVFDSPLLDPLL
jgi:hypothetical protein